MARIILIVGGCRSGKSQHAQQVAESLQGRHAYVATCPVRDDEMQQRVDAHRKDRAGKGWETFEEPHDLAALCGRIEHEVLLIDCLTLWVSNLMYQAELAGGEIDENAIEAHSRELLESCRSRSGTVVMVTNEVGMGIVPDNAVARRYRDLTGRVNQTIAAEADDVTLVSCGLLLPLKASGL